MPMLPANLRPDLLLLQQDVIQNYLMDAINGAWAAGGFADGGFDAFASNTIGAASSGETYDAGGRYYHNPGSATTNSASGLWTGSGSITYSGSTINCGPGADAAVKTNATFAGDVTFSATISAQQNTSFGLYASAEDGAFVTSTGHGGMNSMTESFRLYRAAATWYAYKGATQVATLSPQPGVGDVIALKRVGLTLSVLVNGATVHTFAATYGGALRANVGEAGGTMSLSNVNWVEAGGSVDMTLLSSALAPAPAVAPGVARLMVMWAPVDASTLNTDFVVEVSRDNGATWTAAAMADTGMTVAGYKVLWGEAVISGQPSGTAVKYRTRSINSKTQRVKAVGMVCK